MQNSIQNGKTITIKPADDVKGGDLVVFSAMVAVAVTDIAAGEFGVCETEGVFDLPKDNTVFAQGQAVYAKSDGTVTADDSGNVPAGKAWENVAVDVATVAVKINA
jgi:predicted RecA/RadA family phage recombinase